MRFRAKDRQRIIDGYLAAASRNMFIAPEFVDWLEGQPEHEAHPWFFGKDDATLARAHRVDLARRMASGLRITVSKVEPTRQSIMKVTERVYPMVISPLSGRRRGGGYVPVDPSDEKVMAELREQGAQSLRSWLERYGDAFRDAGADLTAIEELAGVAPAPALAAE